MSAWRREAACRGMDPNLFVPETADVPAEAAAACASCPVATQCADWARANNERGIIAAGRYTGTPRLQREPAACSTPAGYHAHLRRKEDPCRSCLTAHSQYEAERRRTALQTAVERARERARLRAESAAA